MTDSQLEKAVAHNHAQLFYRNAIARGGEVRSVGNLSFTYDGKGFQSMVAFPSLAEATADEQLDEMMAWYREHPTRGLGCWSLVPPRPADLGARLLARGFQDGWRPCWMAAELAAITEEIPAQLQIVADNQLSLQHLKEIPYTGEQGAVSPLLLRSQPDITRQFIALVNGKIVGHSSLFLTEGELGVAGIYDVAVAPSARRKGFGKALVRAACLYARTRGYRYAVLNATGRRMYEQAGFRHIGEGMTWWWFSTGYPPQFTV
ncbi:MAG TPA: GNAT family N-acetyltransferase [Puia sp.]